MFTASPTHPTDQPSHSGGGASRAAILGICASLITSVVYADIVATDLSVPAVMDRGGTVDDPALYIIGQSGPVAHAVDSGDDTIIGDLTSHNHLVIRNGSTYSVPDSSAQIGWGADHNTVTVSGPGSQWMLSWLAVGFFGSHNRLIIENGGRVSNTWNTSLGMGEGSRHNAVIITGAGSRWDAEPIALEGGGHNSLIIENGGVLATTYGHSWIGRDEYSPNNTVRVSGPGSAWLNAGGLVAESPGNIITVDNGGLITVRGDYGFDIAVGLDNHVRLNGGSIAAWGYYVDEFNALIDAGIFQYWNGSDWVAGDRSSFVLGYIGRDSEAKALTGHDDLGGYTIITVPYVAPIPEPATAGALAGLGALVLRASRRNRPAS